MERTTFYPNRIVLITFAFFLFSLNLFSQSQSSIYTNSDITISRKTAITNASEKARPAIVGINVTAIENVIARNPYMDPFFGLFGGSIYQEIPQKVHSLGSGFIISPDGYILTNHHVAGNAKEIIVTLISGEKYNAKIIGSDRTADIALLKIDAKNLPYLKLGNSGDLMIGEWAIAMGNPFGLFDINSKPTITVGVISNLDVNMINDDNDGYDKFYRIYKGIIQTDAAISSGNSGGPLLNSNGEVIGMNTMIFSTSQSNQGSGSIGIGFAIPVNRIKNIIDLLSSKQKIDRNIYLGLDVDEITPEKSKYFGFEKQEGIYITRIFRNSPAEKAGLDVQDIILSINDMKIFRPDDYFISVFDTKVGDKLTFEILRNGKILKKDVILISSRR